MLNPKSTSFRATAAFLVGITTYFLAGREWGLAHAAQQSGPAASTQKASVIDPLRLTNPEAWAAAEKQKAEAKRQQALLELRSFTHAGEQEEKAKAVRELAKKVEAARPTAKLERELARGLALKLPENELQA